jgi:hypothetical protein
MKHIKVMMHSLKNNSEILITKVHVLYNQSKTLPNISKTKKSVVLRNTARNAQPSPKPSPFYLAPLFFQSQEKVALVIGIPSVW